MANNLPNSNTRDRDAEISEAIRDYFESRGAPFVPMTRDQIDKLAADLAAVGGGALVHLEVIHDAGCEWRRACICDPDFEVAVLPAGPIQ
jgi:hypothetical protein